MSDPATCEVCWATVPRGLMYFHRTWHDNEDDRAPRLFAAGEVERTVEELLVTVAQLKGLPVPTARAAFVRELRDRLIAEALEAALSDSPETECSTATLPGE